MKIKQGYRLRKVGNNSIVVSLGGINFTGLITINETGAYIWEKLENEAEPEDIVASLAADCEVAEDEIRDDVLEFIDKLKGADLVE